jgi:hypothetical protein
MRSSSKKPRKETKKPGAEIVLLPTEEKDLSIFSTVPLRARRTKINRRRRLTSIVGKAKKLSKQAPKRSNRRTAQAPSRKKPVF